MLISEIEAQVRKNLDDAGITFFTAPRIFEAAEEAYAQTVILSGSIEYESEIAVQVNKCYYDLPALLPEFYTIVAIYYNEGKKWLIPRSLKTLDIIQGGRNWEIWNGTPEYFCPVSWKYTAIVPSPAVASGTLRVFYKRHCVEPVQSFHLVQLPNAYITCVTDRATAECLEMIDEYGKAQSFWQSSFTAFSENRTATDSRGLSDLARGYSSIVYGSNP